MPTVTRSNLDAALDLLCQKIELRVEAKLKYEADQSFERPTAALLVKATEDLRLAVSAYNQEASSIIALERDEHYARVIEENTRAIQ